MLLYLTCHAIYTAACMYIISYTILSESLAKRKPTLKLMVTGSCSMLCTVNETMALVFVLATSSNGSRVSVTIAMRGVKNGVNIALSKWFPCMSQPETQYTRGFGMSCNRAWRKPPCLYSHLRSRTERNKLPLPI